MNQTIFECSCCGKHKLRTRAEIKDKKTGRAWIDEKGRLFYGNHCFECRLLKQRFYRKNTANYCTRNYEKTKQGFLMRVYQNMKGRVEGRIKNKSHLYFGKTILGRAEFYEWSMNSSVFHKLFDEWRLSSFQRKFTPSVDRVDSSSGYDRENIEWVTFSENCRRGAIKKLNDA